MSCGSIFDAFPELKRIRNQIIYNEKQMSAPICPPWFRSFEYDKWTRQDIKRRTLRKRQTVWQQIGQAKPRPRDLPLDFTVRNPKPIAAECYGIMRHYELRQTAFGNWRIIKKS